ncbi:phosphate uptake regulator, PhoU [Parvibaculum lavamentivorans DS-1]|uniref:Phosphate-specific transport system accessory protein PhoU n=1 Tax=Parvibaculum lavamentivorans (strain DS-1 / DSM 13023 / NCIMB 13966) TaxID=402881 RepID=A7HQ38_PARL1|nr:phosphate signaling complex protein PhoU [Parvibaculum lavamentivorans]ABS62021.1 phosphate uptake regulator, PhoU [Parvibaculum lavamentivorans DS-1]
MTQHIVKSFQEELDGLSAQIAQMGGLTEAQLQAAIEAVVKRDTQLAERTIREDQRIDTLEAEIENQAIRLIALRQPMAADLREAIAAIKISIDLERIGDLAKNIAKRAMVLQNDFEGANRLIQGISRMGRLAQRQLKQVLDAYSNREAQAAMEVWRDDEEIDAMYNSVFRELLTYMMEDPRTIGVSTHLLFIAKNIERIGDHATNIAETVGYLVTGEWVHDERPKGDTTSTTAVHSGS